MNSENENNDQIQEALKAYGLKQDIGRIHKEMMLSMAGKKSVTPVRRITATSMKVAATILLLLFATVVGIYFNATPENLFKNKYETYLPSLQRGSDVHANDLKARFMRGQNYLKNDDAGNAISEFKSIMDASADSNEKVLYDDAEYYLALSYLKASQPGNALPIFKNIYANKRHLYHDKINGWYLLLVKIAAWKNK